LRQIEAARARGAAVVCLMSGNLTQRGDFAIADKLTRAHAALSCGADLVLELPFPYCASGAEFFAAAGVCILDALGIDEINFGSECGDRERILAAAKIASAPDFDEKYRAILDRDPTLGAARAYFELFREAGLDGDLPPNDILGLAYFKAALRAGCESKLTVIKREGAGYSDENLTPDQLPSATALRRLMLGGDVDAALAAMPPAAADALRAAASRGEAPCNTRAIESAILAFFRLTDPASLDGFAEAGGGLAHRLCAAARESADLDGFFAAAASKRYTDARLRRAVINCMVGVTPADLRATPAYVQLLAANATGRELLSSMKKTSAIPVVTKPADAESLGEAAARQYTLTARADALFTLTLPTPRPVGEYIRRRPIITE
jgi:predicted nucleotidyltransferase